MHVNGNVAILINSKTSFSSKLMTDDIATVDLQLLASKFSGTGVGFFGIGLLLCW